MWSADTGLLERWLYEVQKGCSDKYPHFIFTAWPLEQLDCQCARADCFAVFR